MSSKHHIISFDLDDTLFDNGPVIGHAFEALYDYMVTCYPGFETHFSLLQYIQHAEDTRLQYPDIFDYSILRKIHIESALKIAGFDQFDTEAAYCVFLDARQKIQLYPESKPMLEELSRRNYRIISISNGNADPLRIGLEGYFSNSFNPTNIGAAKPDPTMYLKVCEQLNIRPNQLIHIGDCLTNDFDCANQAGCVGVWFNVKKVDSNIKRQFSHLHEIPDLISSFID